MTSKEYQKDKTIIVCECGFKFQKCSLSRHLTSKKHINYINKIAPNLYK